MCVVDFSFDFLDELIVCFFKVDWISSCLLIFDGLLGKVEYKVFSDILLFVNENDLFVFNNIKVIFVCMFG